MTKTRDLADLGGGFIQAGTGAVQRTVESKLQDVVSVKDFGAVGNGVADDTAAIQSALAALQAGGVLRLREGDTYKVSQTLVLTKPVNIIGGSKENTKFLFAASGSYLAAPHKCGIIAIHSSTTVPGYSGDARRSVLSGFTVQMEAGPTAMRGIIIACPVYLKEVDAVGFSADGFAVMAGAASPVNGNANGTELHNCTAQNNSSGGFYLVGNDANSCLLSGCRAFTNGTWGFYDDSLLGNTYIGCEADFNTDGGYFATSGKPNRSFYLGCYAEGNQTPCWSLGSRCIRIGSLGSLEDNYGGTTGTSLTSIPRGAAYFNKDVVVATNASVAESLSGGAVAQLSDGKFYLLSKSGGLPFQISETASTNYLDFYSNSIPAIRFPNSAVTGNLAVARPFFPGGLSLGSSGRSAIVGAGTAAPTTGSYDAGAIWLNDLPSAGGFVGWVCVTTGTPGTWKTFGAISA
jgi:parallel beta-helix repeat protein